MELERRVHAMLEENELLQNTVDDLRERTLVFERQCHEKDLQVQTHKFRTFRSQIFEEYYYYLSCFFRAVFQYTQNNLSFLIT